VGFLLIKQAKNDGSESDENDGKIIDFKPYKFDDDEELSSIDPECFYLIAYQGKSRFFLEFH
jgi:hypothetical protein